MPTGLQLRDMACDRFLKGTCKDRSLPTVTSYVNNEHGPQQLESWLAELLSKYRPSSGHLLLPAFRWHAIFTLNYDRLVEDAYAVAGKSALQSPMMFHRNENGMDRRIAEKDDALGFFKLHGTIELLGDPVAPVVLSQEGYLLWREGRERLYTWLSETVADYPVVFCGTALGDPHIQEILSKDAASRPMQYIVDPFLNEHDEQLFAGRRITPIKSTFDQFMAAIDSATSPANRKLGGVHTVTVGHTIQRHYRSHAEPTPEVVGFLTRNVEHVTVPMKSSAIRPADFYKGDSQTWDPIEQGWDVQRVNYDSAMLRTLSIQSKKDSVVDVLAVTGAAGAGKTVFLRRMAFDLANNHGQLVLFAPPRAILNVDRFRDIYEATGLKLVVCIDHAADQLKFVLDLSDHFSKAGAPLTVILADTQAAWGQGLEDFADLLRFKFELRQLETSEIDGLIAKLAQHKCLGVLESASGDQRRKAFDEVADRQLLVALYHATQGRELEEIIFDEYQRIKSAEAQELYLLVSTLNQFRTPVRAGLVRRVTGFGFQDFEQRFLAPLSGIVIAERDPILRDMVYRTRHPYIAEILFRAVLDTNSKRVAQYLRILEHMDPSYSSDAEALRRMVHYANLRTLTPSISERRRVLEIAESRSQGDPSVLQQRALMEMNDTQGDLAIARAYIERALKKRERDPFLRHTKATLLQREAQTESNPLERRVLRNEAKAILRSIKAAHSDGYTATTTAAIAIDEITELLEGGINSATEPRLLRLVEDAERAIRDGLVASPDFERLPLQASRLQELLGRNDVAVSILYKALQSRPESEFVAVAYARSIRDKELDNAIAAVTGSLVHKPNSPILNQTLFELMLAKSNDARPELWGPLRRGFTNEDGNVPMHVHAIRYHFVRGDIAAYTSAIQVASRIKVRGAERERLRFPYPNPASADGRFAGRVAHLTETFGFVAVPGFAKDLYMRPSLSMENEVWDSIARNAEVTVVLQFNLGGAVASYVKAANVGRWQ